MNQDFFGLRILHENSLQLTAAILFLVSNDMQFFGYTHFPTSSVG